MGDFKKDKNRKKRQRSSSKSSCTTLSSSSQSSDTKKLKKEAKRQRRTGKKAKKQLELEKCWPIVRKDVERLILDLLAISADTAKAILKIFSEVDRNQWVRVDGLSDKRVRRKLRHLFSAVRLAERKVKDGSGHLEFGKSNECKIKLTKAIKPILKKCIQDFHAMQEAATTAQSVEISTIADETAVVGPSWVEEEGNDEVSDDDVGPLPQLDPMRRTEESYVDKGGPTSSANQRQAWMTECPDSMKACFEGPSSNTPGGQEISESERYLNEREQSKMLKKVEKYRREHGTASLLEMHKEGTYSESDRLKGKQRIEAQQRMQAPWGVPMQQQRASGLAKENKGSSSRLMAYATTNKSWGESEQSGGKGIEPNDGEPWRRFDREKDLLEGTRRKVTETQFTDLVEQSKSMRGRFGQTKFESSFV